MTSPVADFGKSKNTKNKNKTEDSAHHYLLRYNMRRLDTHSTKKKLWCSHKVNVKLHSAAALQQ